MRHFRHFAFVTTLLATGACAGDATTSPVDADTPAVTPNTGGDLPVPTLPATTLLYADANNPLPRHFLQAAPNAGSPIGADNTPASNLTTNAGATLGRVLFYDRRLSVNDRVSCSSCHQQQFAFSDTAKLSRGFTGGFTGRHSMGLTNARFYASARFFWDERAASLEAQVLQPIQDGTEMGMTLPNVITKLSATTYYPALFAAAFGSSEITSDRVALALSQFVRSLVSVNSKFDRAFGVNGVPNFAATFTAQELAGQDLFNGRAGCARCHGTNAHISDGVHNTGLDATITDVGAGNGRFKAPSLRNIAVRPPYMHDGRFQTLEQVIAFYDSGVQNNPGLDPRLRGGPGGNGLPLRLNLSAAERASLVAFLGTLTDNTFLTDVRFSNPFGR
jgi:cytochrome c peroxidase